MRPDQVESATATVEPIVQITGPAFHQVYPRCVTHFKVRTAGSEVFVTYATDGIDRIDRLGPRGEVVEALDLDPGPESRGARTRGVPIHPAPTDDLPPKYGRRWPAQPMGNLLDLSGTAGDDFFVSAEFHEVDWLWESRVAHYHNGAWSELRPGGPWLFEWGGRIMEHGEIGFRSTDDGRALSFQPLLEEVARLHNVDLDSVFFQDIVVLARGADAAGPLAVLVTHVPDPEDATTQLGTWLLLWTDPEQDPTIERITSRVMPDFGTSLRVIGQRLFIQFGDEPEFEWRSGERVELRGLQEVQAVAAGCERGDEGIFLLDLDGEGRMWAQQGDCLAIQTGDEWTVEPLPSGVRYTKGLRSAPLWVLDEQNTIWSREGPRRWATHALTLVGDQQWPRFPDFQVTGPGDAWLVFTYDESDEHEEALDPLGQLWRTSEVFTTRPVETPNPCR